MLNANLYGELCSCSTEDASHRHFFNLVEWPLRSTADPPSSLAPDTLASMTTWRNVDAVIENRLYLGNISAARSSRSLTERRITHILSVCNEPIPAELPESGMRHMRIPVEDVDYADLLIYLPSALRFIDQALRDGGVVLVHCVQGISRSATVITAYVMWARRMNATRALEFVRSVRPQIWPNPGFQEQLVLFELCEYNPSPSNGIYASWRARLNHRLAAEGL